MGKSFKKGILVLLSLILVIEGALFGVWVVSYGGKEKLARLFSNVYEEVIVFNASPESKDLRIFSENISEVNDALSQALVSVPDALKRELASTRLQLMLANKLGGYTRSFTFEDGAFNESPNTRQSDLFYSYSPNGEKIVFMALPDGVEVKDGLNWGELAQVYTAKKNGLVSGFPSLENSLQQTATSLPFKQFGSISDTGEVLFNSGEHIVHRETEEAEDFGVHRIKDGKTTYITQGFQPQWLSNDEFLVLKNDGMYKFSADGLQSELIIPKPGVVPVHKNEKFDISADGTTIAWTMPGEQKVYMYTKDQTGFAFKGTVPTKALQPELSPSGDFLTFYNTVGEGAMQYAKIEFYETDTFTKVPELEISLTDFNPRTTFITEWVQK